jgi:hypothetical protein
MPSNTITWREAKEILVEHLRAFLYPYEAEDSEEIVFFFPLIYTIMENPDVNLDRLCVTALKHDFY